MIIFAATTTKTNDECKDKPTPPIECLAGPTTTIDSEDGNGGFKPKPIELVIPGGADLKAKSLRARIEAEIAKDPQLRGSYFGVIIIYGGSLGVGSGVGSNDARDAEKKLSSNWSRVKDITYFEIGHHSRRPVGTLELKLFPSISDIAQR